MDRLNLVDLRPGLSVRQRSTGKSGAIVAPTAGESVAACCTWVNIDGCPQQVNDDLDVVQRHIRLTVRHKPNDSEDDLKVVGSLRRDLQVHSPAEIDYQNPFSETQRDGRGNVYFEFATEYPEDVRKMLSEYEYADRVAMEDLGEVSLVCLKCGYFAGFVTICPNCGQREIAPCSHCGREVPRERYRPKTRDLSTCPECGQAVYLRLNEETKQATLTGHKEMVLSVSFSPNGKTLASGSYDKTINLWDVKDGSKQLVR